MTIKSGGQFGNVLATLQGQTNATKKASTASVSAIQRLGAVTNSEKSALSGDVVNTQSSNGALSDYTNPDLESVLSSIGFSTMRSEMLAAFEFQPFLDESSIKSGSSSLSEKNLSTTSAAELADLHSQLKQLRCTEVMEFLEKYVGLTTRSSQTGEGLEWSTSSDDNGVLDDYSERMENAKEVIETLTTIYNAMLPVLEAMQVKTNDYKGSTSMFSMSMPSSVIESQGIARRSDSASGASALATISSNIATDTPAGKIGSVLVDETYDTDYVSSSVIGEVSLQDYIKEYLQMREVFWESSSGNVILTQLMLDIVMRLFFPIYAYSEQQGHPGSQSGFKGAGGVGAFNGTVVSNASQNKQGNVKGFGSLSDVTEIANAIKRLSHINMTSHVVHRSSETQIDNSWWSSSWSEGDDSNFTQGDFKRLWNLLSPTGDAGEDSQINIGKALSLIASDIMTFGAIRSQKFSLDDYVEGVSSSSTVSDIMKTLFGIKTGFDSKTLADISPTKTGTCLAVTYPKNTDSTINGKVAAFTYQQGDLTAGTYPLRTGKSYFIDEIFTGEMGSVKTRLEKFADRLNQARSNLVSSAQILKFPSSDSSFTMSRGTTGTGATVQGKLCPSALTSTLYDQAASHISGFSSKISDGDANYWARGLVVLAALQDFQIAWKLFRLFMLISYARSLGGISLSSSNSAGKVNSSTIGDIISDISQRMIELWPSLQGGTAEKDIEVEGQYNYDASTPDEDLFFGQGNIGTLMSAAAGNESYIAHEPPDATYYGAEDISDALWQLVNDSISESSSTVSDSILTFGSEAVDAFVNKVASTYFVTGMAIGNNGALGEEKFSFSEDNATTPYIGTRYEGAVAISYFFMLHMWNTLSITSSKNSSSLSYTSEMQDAIDAYYEAVEEAGFFVSWSEAEEIWEAYQDLLAAGYDTDGDGDQGKKINEYTPNTFYFNGRDVSSLEYAVENAIANRASSEDIDGEISAGSFASSEWDGESGYNLTISKYLSQISEIYWSQVESEKNLWNSMWLCNNIIEEMYSSVTSLIATLEGNNITQSKFEEVFDSLKTTDELKETLFLCVSRDQLSLNAALYDSLSVTNREYPYLPATKAVMVNQIKNLATVSTLGPLVNTTSSGKKRILTIGIPTGFVDRLRSEMINSGKGLSYYKSSVISLQIWRRNMADDSEMTKPKEFRFDMSKFIIEGRTKSTSGGSEVLDAAAETQSGQTAEDVFNNTVVTTYNPEQDVYSTMGKAYSEESLSSSSKGTEIFQNLVLDHYLKLYIKSTTGFDVSEEIFPVSPNKIFIDDVDDKKKKLLSKLKKELAESFPTRDVTSAINYDRILGELTRSVLLSPSKWANRTFYPKVFDRVFCVLVDEDDFSATESDEGYDTSYVVDLSTGDVDYESASSSIAVAELDEANPKYYQFFCTVSLLAPMNDEQSESESELTSEEATQEVATSDVGYDNLFPTSNSALSLLF